MTDATCYKSYLHFPTDIKLLWECCHWLHTLLVPECKHLSERIPRSKYNNIDKARLAYAKQRKHTASSTRKLRRRLLRLLSKLLSQWNRLHKQYNPCICLSAEQEKRLSAVREVCLQQSELFSGKEVKHRIVSIDRPLPPFHCQRQGKQACGVWCKSQQHTDRRHIIHRVPQL